MARLNGKEIAIKLISTLISSKFQAFVTAIGAVVLLYLKGEIEGDLTALLIALSSAVYQWFRAYEDSNR